MTRWSKSGGRLGTGTFIERRSKLSIPASSGFISVTGISFLFEHDMKKLARAMQIRLGSILRNAKQCRHFANSRAEPIVQPQRRLVDLGERSNALCQGLIALRRFNLPVRSRFRSHRAKKNGLVRVRTSKANPRLQVHRVVERNPVDPGAEFGFSAKRVDGVVNLEKDLLRHVFRFRNELPPQNRNREAKHLSAMTANQLRES